MASSSSPAFALADLSLTETRTGSTAPLTLTMTMPQIYNIVRCLAAGYAKSFPGMDNVSINTAFHTDVRLLISGEERYENKIDALLKLGYTLSYRLECMAMGTYYKEILGLDYPDCTSCSVEGWTFPLYESKQREAKEKLFRYNKIKSLISDANIFSAASDGQGYDYDKPEEYLAIALVESQKTWEDVEKAISILKDVHAATLAPKVEAVRRGRWFLDQAEQILKPVKKTLRSISPRRKRKSVIPSK